jgi:hypothetical protein
MRCLYVKTLWLYPRFQLGVKTCLDAQAIEVRHAPVPLHIA